MADTRLKTPSHFSLHISEITYRLMQGAEQFFSGFARRSKVNDNATLSRAEAIREIVRARNCTCDGTCPHCQHIIEDVVGK